MARKAKSTDAPERPTAEPTDDGVSLDVQIAQALGLPPAPYSSSIADAWRVALEMHNRGFFLYLSDMPGGWEAVYVTASGWDSSRHRAQTAESAIVSAALEAAQAQAEAQGPAR